jgi:hypothetical protein
MKRPLGILLCAIFLISAPSAFAQGPQGAGAKSHNRHFHWFHWKKRQHKTKTPPLYTVPKSRGWFHKGPGPAGAGAK